MSIAIVIIGLLIGGILVGQSLISSVKNSSQVKQIQQFDAGVATFKTKFKYLPGDAPAFGGDGDGIIEDQWGQVILLSVGEMNNFWNNFNKNDYAIVSNPVRLTGTLKSAPAAKIGRKNSFFLASPISANNHNASLPPRHFYFMLSSGQPVSSGAYTHRFATTTSTNSPATPAELLAIDRKMDDGIANTGDVLSSAIGGSAGGGAPWHGAIGATPLATCSSGATYVTTNSGYECTPLIRIGAQTGNRQ